MSGSSSQSPAISYGPAATHPHTTNAFQSTDVASSSSSSFGGLEAYPGANFRMKSDSTPYNYDEQAPRSQQPHGNYTHQDLGHVGGLAQTQALGAAAPPYGESSRSVAGGHFSSQHTRHSSLASSIGQLGISNGEASLFSHDGNSSQNYGAYSSQRTGLVGANLSGTTEISPTRSRFPTAPSLHDARQVSRPAGRPLAVGMGIPGSTDATSPRLRGHGGLPDGGNSPRSLKRAAEHLDDPRSISDHTNQLRRPASFPVINASGSMPYGRQMQADPRAAQTIGRNRGRGGQLLPGQTTPGRPPMILPGSFGDDGRRDSFSSSQTIPSPFVGSSSSSEELPAQYSVGGYPQLVRSTQIPGSSGPLTGSIGSDPIYSPPSLTDAPKARLELHGNLNDMAVGWTHDEWRSGRRLVQFWRRQEGSVIHATWRPITPSQYVPNSIVISCIFRDEKNECFVTSVDTIYLLEALVASRFTVEEKNRIRRNLEGFRPITVSKSKRECDAFFKRIMSFPNPKPRNIEKDVKVFPWKVLSSALCKIISKYSPLYESTLVVSDQWAPELGGGTGQPMGAPSGGMDPGRYREGEYALTSTPVNRDVAQFDRQGYAGGGPSYGAPHGSGGGSGAASSIGGTSYSMYGSATPGMDFHSRSRSTGSAVAFSDLMPSNSATGSAGLGTGFGGAGYSTGAPTDGVPFPSQGDGGYSHPSSGSSGYDSFPGGATGPGSGSNPPGGGGGAEPPSSFQTHHRDMSGSTLAGATGYYSDRRA